MSVTEPRLLASRYEVGDLIGRGGMAEVHAGWDTRIGRDVAIKMLRSDLARDSSFILRFRREAQSAAALSHPSIVAVFDSGEQTIVETGGADLAVPFIVMELLHGRTLRDILHQDGPLHPARAARIIADTVRALGYSHEHGIVHRDVKPANVMVCDDGEIKVMDFGIARAIADTAATMTNTAVVIGTAQYLSPEQAQGHDVDARSDLYSAGCLLFELLTGRTPFVGDSPVAVAYQHVGEQPAAPSTFAEGIPQDLDAVVLHVLEKDRADRYQTAEEFAADLDRVVHGWPVSDAALASLPAPVRTAEHESTGPTRDRQPVLLADEDTHRIPSADPDTGTLPAVAPPDPKARRRRLLVLLGVLAVALVSVVVLLVNGVIGPARSVTVPNVVRLTETTATERLNREGLTTVLQREASSLPAGTVFGQDPAGDSKRPPESAVTLWVSSGPRMVKIPDLTNYDQTSARQRLTDLGLQVGAIRQVDSVDVGVGNVVGTDPKAGKELVEGSTVVVFLSNGKVKVPSVVGNSEATARATLNRLGLQVKPARVDSQRPVGTVIAQSYAGQRVAVGTIIEVQISKGVPPPPPTTTVTKTITPSPTPSSGSPTASPDSSVDG